MACQVVLWQSLVASAADSAVVLMYHRFGEDAYPSTNLRLDQLEAHISVIKAGGHVVIPLAEVVEALNYGQEIPERAVALTVDDAYESFWTEGWPRFRAAGFPVTLFVATDAVDQAAPGMMNWDKIRSAEKEGVTVAAHSAAHTHYPSLGEADVESDLARMNSSFLEHLGAVPTLFAYPYGEAGTADMALVEAAGFAAAFGQHSGPVYSEAGRYYLPRFPLNEAFGELDRFRLVIDTLPLKVTSISPHNPVLTNNPPSLTLAIPMASNFLKSLTCYGPGGHPISTTVGASLVHLDPEGAFPLGRVRINCTLREQGSRWRWFGWQMIAGFVSDGLAVHGRYQNQYLPNVQVPRN